MTPHEALFWLDPLVTLLPRRKVLQLLSIDSNTLDSWLEGETTPTDSYLPTFIKADRELQYYVSQRHGAFFDVILDHLQNRKVEETRDDDVLKGMIQKRLWHNEVLAHRIVSEAKHQGYTREQVFATAIELGVRSDGMLNPKWSLDNVEPLQGLIRIIKYKLIQGPRLARDITYEIRESYPFTRRQIKDASAHILKKKIDGEMYWSIDNS